MERRGLEKLPDVSIVRDYTLRTFEQGDEAGLGRVFAASALGSESVEQVRSRLHAHACFEPARVFVAVSGELIVGTASAWRSEREPDVGYLHMLGVLPEHRGKQLGAALTLATLHYTRVEGLPAQRLLTDDWRLPAIRLYFRLGYDPILTDWTHRMRWRNVARRLKQPEIVQRARKVNL